MITLDNSSKSTKADLKSWIASLGFERGNPFATVEAEQERILLPEYFVDVDSYERIKGDKTIIVFAPRGGGKSALRIVLASYASPISPESKTLVIEYTDFAPLITRWRAKEQLTVEDHTNQLLRLAVKTLFISLCGESAGTPLHRGEIRNVWEQRSNAVKRILLPVRSRIAQWIRTYQPQLLEPEELYERLNALDANFVPDWGKFCEFVTTRKLRELIIQYSLEDNEVATFLADLNDFSVGNINSLMTPTEKISAFVTMTRSLGFNNVQILVDGLDEAQETANDPQAQIDILEPLVAELHVLELPAVTFKFFLSLEAHEAILERPTIRRDRLTDQAVTMEWNKDHLKRLLDERLAVFSNEKIHELVQICQEMFIDKGSSSCLIGEWIEKEMLRIAQGSPRRLLLAAQLLFEAHVSVYGASGLVGIEDWESAKKQLIHKMPPILRLYQDKLIIEVGEREIGLTALQHRILLTLATTPDVCDRDRLVREGWRVEAGVSQQAIDKTISRLRDLLDDDHSDPIYVRTIKGKGFQLRHHKIV